MTNPSLPQAKIVGRRSHGSGAAAKGGAKFLSAKTLRNPLTMLDSDERIQGNPSLSNPHKQGFSRPNGPSPRKPKPGRLDLNVAPCCCGEEPNRLHPNAKQSSPLSSVRP